MPFFNAERIFVSSSELLRVQSVSSSFSQRRAQSNYINGNKTANTNVHDLISATLTFGYVGVESYNEGLMGFSGDFIGNIISGNDLKNYQIQVQGGGSINTTGAVLTAFESNCSVGEYPKRNVTFDIFEMGFTSSTTATGVTSIPTIAAILPGNIDLQVSGGCGVSSINIQSYHLNVSIPREYSTYINNLKPTIKKAVFPIQANLTIEAYADQFATGDMASYFNTESGVNLTVTYKDKQGNNTNGGFRLTNAQMINQDLSNNVMERTKITFEFTSTLGIVDTKNSPKGTLYIGI